MKISGLIEELEFFMGNHGDLEVVNRYKPTYTMAHPMLGKLRINKQQRQNEQKQSDFDVCKI